MRGVSPPDMIDIVNDTLSGGDYQEEEDPRLYVSHKTGRGPLSDTWMEHPPNGTIMCAYKLIKVRLWHANTHDSIRTSLAAGGV